MNAKELIIGHFEGSLSPAEQGRLDHMLESSPEVRAQFDQQKMIEESMAEDSRSLVPPIGLREATIAAALGGGIATIGGGLGAWFTGKIAAIFGTVLVGGLVVGGTLIYGGDDEVVEDTAPVVQFEESELPDKTSGPSNEESPSQDNSEGNSQDVSTSSTGTTTAAVVREEAFANGSAETDDQIPQGDVGEDTNEDTNALSLETDGQPTPMNSDTIKVNPTPSQD